MTTDRDSPAVLSLDEIGIRCGTDKSSLRHSYLAQYDRMLNQWRDKPLTLMEIGIFNGASLTMWSRYFQAAQIVGVDIEPSCRQYAGGRIVVEIGSQGDAAFLDQIGRAYRPEIIIDDGSHRADHVVISFEALFEHLAPGGVYIVEDVSSHGHPGAEQSPAWGDAKINPIDYFLELQRQNVAQWLSVESQQVFPGRVFASIERTEVSPGLIAIWKKDPATAPWADFDALEALVAESSKDEAWIFLAEYYQHKIHDLARAEGAASKAVDLMPLNSWSYLRLGLIKEARGDFEGATATLEGGVTHGRGDPYFDDQLARLKARIAVRRG